MTLGKLTKKQKLVYDFICEYLDENGFSPTQTEIQEHFGFKSLGSVQDYIRYLTNAGYLVNDTNAVRGLEPVRVDGLSNKKSGNNIQVNENANYLDIPLLGSVAAGTPIETSENSDLISVPQTMIKRGNHYALTVSGNSMIEDGIFDGDLLVVKEQKTANNGETVIACINNEATVKRYQKRKNFIELIPANETLKPIIVPASENFEIRGIVVGLMRQY